MAFSNKSQVIIADELINNAELYESAEDFSEQMTELTGGKVELAFIEDCFNMWWERPADWRMFTGMRALRRALVEQYNIFKIDNQ